MRIIHNPILRVQYCWDDNSHRRYYYRIRPVYKDGAKGAFSDPFSAITRQMIRNE